MTINNASILSGFFINIELVKKSWLFKNETLFQRIVALCKY